MELGNPSCELRWVGRGGIHVDKIGQEEVRVGRTRSILPPPVRRRYQAWNERMDFFHRRVFPKHHGFAVIFAGTLFIAIHWSARLDMRECLD